MCVHMHVQKGKSKRVCLCVCVQYACVSFTNAKITASS